MPRPIPLLPLFCLLVNLGCGGPATKLPDHDPSSGHPASSEPAPPPPSVEPTEIRVTDDSLSFDPASVRETAMGTLGLGLGSASVRVLGRTNDICTFEYTFEIEGGYTRYRVEVDTDSGPVTIRAQPDPAEVVTSFDVEDSELVGSGNLLLDPGPSIPAGTL